MSGSMDYGVASHTSLSDSPVAHPSLFPFSGETNKYVIFGRTWCYWTFLSDFIWAWVSVIQFMGFYITGYCWWPAVLSERKTGVTLLYDNASGVLQEWICDVSATSPLQVIVPRVLLWRLCDVRYEPLVGMCTSILTILEVYLFCEFVEIAFELGCSSLRCVDVGVTLWTLGTIYIHRSVPVMLGGPSSPETRQRWSYVFTMSSLGWICCHDIE
ncbi:hypothetical protein YC2023_065512 [Brassica napus]